MTDARTTSTPTLHPAPQRDALHALLEDVARERGEAFFRNLVQVLASALRVRGAWITEYEPESQSLRALAFWLDDGFVDDYRYATAGTVCEGVVSSARLVHVPDRALELYPADDDLRRLGAVSYLGMPLLDLDGQVLGHLAVLDTTPMPEDARCLAVFQMLASRASAELQRWRRASPAARAATAAAPGDAQRLEEALRTIEGPLLGRSAPMRRVLAEIAQVAPTTATVLILGETGTGKELVARAIHEGSSRAGRPFVKVNCAAIPENLIESELFGHERGAFTGATQRRDGRFTVAHGGTIFLDEIGELPLALQAKLLRVLQEGELEPVGSSRTRRVDVRVVAATNRDLRAAVAAGSFRGDLYFRVNVFPIRVPPLRERGNDVVLLAQAFAREAAARLGRQLSPIGPLAAAQLRAYHWPGNVRELQNVIERAVITARGPQLNLLRLLAETSEHDGAEGARPTPSAPGIAAERRVLHVAEIEALERHNILLALEQTGWRVAGDRGAAVLLGLRPSTLASRMKALGIQRPSTPEIS